jgi:hypothetical protein
LIRITITDHEQTVSFLTNRETLLRLIAGCSVNPASLEELLLATDIYQRGIAAAIMADLMEFDKAIHRKGADFLRAAISQARASGEAFAPAFQVVNAITAEEAFARRGCELAAIDLIRQVIRHSAGLDLTIAGEINVNTDRKPPAPTVTYILPQGWTIQAL